MGVKRPLMAAVTVVQASVFGRGGIECNPYGERGGRIAGAEVEVVLMNWFWAADLGWFAEDLTKEYGESIQDWDVSRLSDFSRVFDTNRNQPFTGKPDDLIRR